MSTVILWVPVGGPLVAYLPIPLLVGRVQRRYHQDSCPLHPDICRRRSLRLYRSLLRHFSMYARFGSCRTNTIRRKFQQHHESSWGTVSDVESFATIQRGSPGTVNWPAEYDLSQCCLSVTTYIFSQTTLVTKIYVVGHRAVHVGQQCFLSGILSAHRPWDTVARGMSNGPTISELKCPVRLAPTIPSQSNPDNSLCTA